MSEKVSSRQYLYDHPPPARTRNRDAKMKCLPVVLLLAYLPFLSKAVSPPQYPSVVLPLSALLDNQAASPDGSADFDAHGASFDSRFLPPGPWVDDGITVCLNNRLPWPF